MLAPRFTHTVDAPEDDAGGQLSIRDVEAGFTGLPWDGPGAFDAMAAAALAYQRAHNPVYARMAEVSLYLPVEAFKLVPIACFPPEKAERVFVSSGTGRSVPSRHYVHRLSVYERAVTTHFDAVFGKGPFTLVAHLPHYAERGGTSSLLYMAELLVRRYGDAAGGFFLDDPALLHAAARRAEAQGTPFILLGAAFGLLDLVEAERIRLPDGALVVETGGMKTYRREVTRADLHARLAEGLGVPRGRVWSEYGMCELMSQCYTRGGDVFFPPPWMRFAVVDPENPARVLPEGQAGALALIDLANLYSASALLTEDRAVRRGHGFEVLGRLSKAELRGCNFLLE